VLGSCKRGSHRTYWDLCLALLLVGLLLYNPFAATTFSNGLAYRSLARHRATVGASEMQHLASMQGENQQQDSAAVLEVFTALLADNNATLSHVVQEEALPQRSGPISTVWFRPPPAA
jgi:hypothetical protein